MSVLELILLAIYMLQTALVQPVFGLTANVEHGPVGSDYCEGCVWPEVQAAELTPLQECRLREDRYNWQKYAKEAGFPDWAMEELGYVISKESGGDLCAINPTSGATCWIQQFPGGDQWLDPVACMSQGYKKWIDGGQDFYKHWYQWWR